MCNRSYRSRDHRTRWVKYSAPALHPATHKQDRFPASKPTAEVPGAGSKWEGLIDLGEPDPLIDAPPAIVATARPTPPWLMIIGICDTWGRNARRGGRLHDS